MWARDILLQSEIREGLTVGRRNRRQAWVWAGRGDRVIDNRLSLGQQITRTMD